MSKLLHPGETYKNRPPGVVPTALCLTREAHARLRELAPSARAHGAFVSALITQYAVKHEEVRTIQEAVEGTEKREK